VKHILIAALMFSTLVAVEAHAHPTRHIARAHAVTTAYTCQHNAYRSVPCANSH
jgi:hypothetical protein